MAILLLIQAGKPNLEARLTALDPFLKGPLAKVTVQQLTRTSGIKNVSSTQASRDAPRSTDYSKAPPLVGARRSIPYICFQ